MAFMREIDNSYIESNAANSKEILLGKKARVNHVTIEGTMPNNGAINQVVNNGNTFAIPEGYHNGNGAVIVPTLESQTPATAVAGNILTGKTAYVKGKKITGTMPNNGEQETWNPSGAKSKKYQAGYYPKAWEVNSENGYNAGYANGLFAGGGGITQITIVYDLWVQASEPKKKRGTIYYTRNTSNNTWSVSGDTYASNEDGPYGMSHAMLQIISITAS